MWRVNVYLMNMVVDMFACNNGGYRVALLGSTLCAGALELSSLLLQASLDCSRVTMVMFFVLHRNDVVLVLFRKDFSIEHRLN